LQVGHFGFWPERSSNSNSFWQSRQVYS